MYKSVDVMVLFISDNSVIIFDSEGVVWPVYVKQPVYLKVDRHWDGVIGM